MRDRAFMGANQVLSGVLRQLRESGQDKTQHKQPIAAGDMSKMYSSGVLSNENPLSLQRKVYVELSIHFGRRGREGLRELTKNSIIIKKDDLGREYATLAYNEIEKNHQAHMPKDQEKRQIMYSQPDDINCPIKSLKLYLDKLNPKCEAFFQRPKNKINKEAEEPWFENKCLGIHKLESMMKSISKDAQLSEVYTNHCLRATTSTILSHAGVEARNICSVTGHRNHSSLESYIREPSLKQRADMCDLLHSYGRENNTNNTKNSAGNSSQLALMNNTTTTSDLTIQNTTSQMAIDTTTAVFAGANFSGETTINVMINKK